MKHLPVLFVVTSPNQPSQLFADSEVVMTKVLGGTAEFWAVVVVVILLVMNCPKPVLRLPYARILRRPPFEHNKTIAEMNLQRKKELAKKR